MERISSASQPAFEAFTQAATNNPGASRLILSEDKTQVVKGVKSWQLYITGCPTAQEATENEAIVAAFKQAADVHFQVKPWIFKSSADKGSLLQKGLGAHAIKQVIEGPTHADFLKAAEDHPNASRFVLDTTSEKAVIVPKERTYYDYFISSKSFRKENEGTFNAFKQAADATFGKAKWKLHENSSPSRKNPSESAAYTEREIVKHLGVGPYHVKQLQFEEIEIAFPNIQYLDFTDKLDKLKEEGEKILGSAGKITSLEQFAGDAPTVMYLDKSDIGTDELQKAAGTLLGLKGIGSEDPNSGDRGRMSFWDQSRDLEDKGREIQNRSKFREATIKTTDSNMPSLIEERYEGNEFGHLHAWTKDTFEAPLNDARVRKGLMMVLAINRPQGSPNIHYAKYVEKDQHDYECWSVPVEKADELMKTLPAQSEIKVLRLIRTASPEESKKIPEARWHATKSDERAAAWRQYMRENKPNAVYEEFEKTRPDLCKYVQTIAMSSYYNAPAG